MTLLEELKDNLKVTGENEDAHLENILARGKEHLKGLTGTDINFEQEGLGKSLLLDYGRYYYNNAVEYFEQSFNREIVRFQYQEAIRVSKEVGNNEE